jgi:hypothetical protein
MMLACKAFVVSEKITPNSILRPGIDYVEISTPRELDQAVPYYLAHPEEREKIAFSGYNRVLDVLDSRKVFLDLIVGIDQNRYPKFVAERGRTFQNMLGILRKILIRTRSKYRSIRIGE